jgi:hypothetical protein
MPKFAKASLHVSRRLTGAERASIAVALELLARTPASEELDALRCEFCPAENLISDEAARALGAEMLVARKVKVCRSKTAAS